MRCGIVLFWLVFLVFFGSVSALPVVPSSVTVEALESGVKISWQYEAGDFNFSVHRGSGFEDAAVIASDRERFFVDSSVESGVEYFYFVTAISSAGEESLPSKGYSVKWVKGQPQQPQFGSKDFNITVVEPALGPAEREFGFGEQIQFVVQVNGNRLGELRDFNAVLINEQLGLRQQFEFDPASKRFFLSVKLPEQQEVKSLPAVYEVWAAASLDGVQLFDFKRVEISLIMRDFVNLENAMLLLVLIFVPIAIISAIRPTVLKWLLQRKAQRDGWRLELDEVKKQKKGLYPDFLRGNLTEWQWKQKEGELQARQFMLEKKLGTAKKGAEPKVDPFAGYTAMEKDEVMRLVQAIGKPKEGETKEQLRTRLIRLGRKEKIAEKAAEMVFKRHESEKQKKAAGSESEKQERDEKGESDEKDKPKKTKQETSESEDDAEIKAEWQRTAEKEESEANKSGKSRK